MNFDSLFTILEQTFSFFLVLTFFSALVGVADLATLLSVELASLLPLTGRPGASSPSSFQAEREDALPGRFSPLADIAEMRK